MSGGLQLGHLSLILLCKLNASFPATSSTVSRTTHQSHRSIVVVLNTNELFVVVDEELGVALEVGGEIDEESKECVVEFIE